MYKIQKGAVGRRVINCSVEIQITLIRSGLECGLRSDANLDPTFHFDADLDLPFLFLK
jgi:hypothetical protein